MFNNFPGYRVFCEMMWKKNEARQATDDNIRGLEL